MRRFSPNMPACTVPFTGLPARRNGRRCGPCCPMSWARSVLDLGCGYGWHCRYFAENGASRVLGIDLSERMLAEARSRANPPAIEYRRAAMEESGFSRRKL